MTERSKLYWDFWEQFRAGVVDEHPDWGGRKTSRTSAWSDLPTGTSRVVFSSAFRPDGLRLQLYFNDQDPAVNLARFEALHAKKDEFELALGEKAVWDEMGGSKAARVFVTSPFDSVTDIDQRPAMIDWLIDQHVRFKRAIQAVGGLESA